MADFLTFSDEVQADTLVVDGLIDSHLIVDAEAIASEAHLALRLRDRSRFDVRYDCLGTGAKRHILQANSIPGLVPEYSTVTRLAENHGINFVQLLGLIVESARKRYVWDVDSVFGDSVGWASEYGDTHTAGVSSQLALNQIWIKSSSKFTRNDSEMRKRAAGEAGLGVPSSRFRHVFLDASFGLHSAPSMFPAWTGDIAIDHGQKLDDISLSSADKDQTNILGNSILRFISIVDTARIPLLLLVGKPYRLSTASAATEAWLSGILLARSHDEENATAWWQSSRTDSSLGILMSVTDTPGAAPDLKKFRTTELLVYAAREPGTDALGVYALPLCSQLLKHQALVEPTPPSSPDNVERDTEARFLPAKLEGVHTDVINVPPTRKRKNVVDAFDEAAERRKQARRNGGVGVAATAARSVSNEALPSLKHRRTISNTQISTRPASRASSVSSVRGPPAREDSLPEQSKRSTLAKVQTAEDTPRSQERAAVESRNKELVSKVVMAGMRLYGLVQSKPRKSRANSGACSPSLNPVAAEVKRERESDEEYKHIYHQVYKGTCFAFRQYIYNKSLALHTEALRETVDKLLAIHCNDPLLNLNISAEDECTPGGRKLFGSAVTSNTASNNPFVMAHAGGESKNNTPCGHKASLKAEPT